ncbi:hypothetical protein Lalb_Chr03g0035311 [Lupinus albus]|uniref:Uncharacterized protein n=1 Tax=Lupinus albus TaxID=3870 RepID=A0A6A4QTP6_LUPAL|nr:hypothetical protein Lalb_Chr03g0035311 [Lupinus albus]
MKLTAERWREDSNCMIRIFNYDVLSMVDNIRKSVCMKRNLLSYVLYYANGKYDDFRYY